MSERAASIPLSISGLVLCRAFLDVQSQSELVREIDAAPWSEELKRRVQHWGYKYDYAARSARLRPRKLHFPQWGRELVRCMLDSGITATEFDQVIVNEYLPGQGISSHIDDVSSFDNEISSISLCSTCVIEFSHVVTGDVVVQLLEPGDLLVIKDEARFQWRHQIRPRKSDFWLGRIVPRARRLSITFRKILLDESSGGELSQ